MISRSRSRQGSSSSTLWLRTPSTKPRHYTLQGLLPLSLLNAPYCAQAQTQAVEPGVEALKESGDRLYFGPPKYGRVRTIALPPFLVEALAAHLAAFRPAQDLVFTSPEGALLRRSTFQRRVWAPAGVDLRLTFHGLRHSAVSILLDHGASPVELTALTRW